MNKLEAERKIACVLTELETNTSEIISAIQFSATDTIDANTMLPIPNKRFWRVQIKTVQKEQE